MSWRKVVLVAVGVPAAAAAAFAGWVYVSFSGGLDDVLDFDKPQPGDAEVVAAEERARVDVVDVAADVRDTMRGALAGDAVTEVGGGLARPQCDVGQHNFKRDDDFDLSCTLTAIDVLVAPGTRSGGATSAAVETALRQEGWAPAGATGGSGADPVVLPVRLTRYDGDRAWQLLVDEADLSTMTYELRGHGGGDLRNAAGRAVSLEELVAGTPRDGYAVVVGVSVEYFRD